jgi:tRNA G18 (ribose-2'-O)-methylase SpoU
VQEDTRNVIDIYKGMPIEAIAKDLASKALPIHIAIENYQHDYNIGTIVRSANAFNVSGVHIVGKRHWNRRGAMATEKYIQLYHHADADSLIDWSSKHKLILIGVDNIDGSKPLGQFKLPANVMLVFGQEGPGLSAAMQKACESIVAIEQYGSTRSINLGVAAGIIMYKYIQEYII